MSCTMEAPGTAAVDLEVLAERIAEGAGHLAAATGAWLGLVAEFDRREGWAVWGVKSCAHWLSWRCGIGLVAGREHVRIARALADLPVIGAALAEGRLSYSKARALTRSRRRRPSKIWSRSRCPVPGRSWSSWSPGCAGPVLSMG